MFTGKVLIVRLTTPKLNSRYSTHPSSCEPQTCSSSYLGHLNVSGDEITRVMWSLIQASRLQVSHPDVYIYTQVRHLPFAGWSRAYHLHAHARNYCTRY